MRFDSMYVPYITSHVILLIIVTPIFMIRLCMHRNDLPQRGYIWSDEAANSSHRSKWHTAINTAIVHKSRLLVKRYRELCSVVPVM